MWRISCIKVDNWKSFKDQTEIPFFEGLNCLTGENGAGKSNVLDAISFALGESPTNLRVKSLKELAGLPNRKVEVELILEHRSVSSLSKQKSDKPTRIGSSIVDGTRYYLVNGSRFPKHRFDETVAELGLHIGGQAVWRINQSEVNRNVSLKPSELYDCISQVSGTKLFNQRRADALRQTSFCKKAMNSVGNDLRKLISEVSSDKKLMEDDERIEELVAELGEIIPGKKDCLIYHQCKVEESLHKIKEDQCREKLNGIIKNKQNYQGQLQELNKSNDSTLNIDDAENNDHWTNDFKVACTKADDCQSELEDITESYHAMNKFKMSLPKLSKSLHHIETVDLPTLESRRKLLYAASRSAELQLHDAQRMALDSTLTSNSKGIPALLQDAIENANDDISKHDADIIKQNKSIFDIEKQLKVCKQECDNHEKKVQLDNSSISAMDGCISSNWQKHFETYHSNTALTIVNRVNLEKEQAFLEKQLNCLNVRKNNIHKDCSCLSSQMRCWMPNKLLPGFYFFEKLSFGDIDNKYVTALDCILGGSLQVRIVETTSDALLFSKEARSSNRSSRIWPYDRIDQPNGSLLRIRKSTVEKHIININKSHKVTCKDPLSLLNYDKDDNIISSAVVKALSNWVIAEDDETAKEIMKLSGGKLRVVTLSGNQHTLGRLIGGSRNSVEGQSKIQVSNNLKLKLNLLNEAQTSIVELKQGQACLKMISDKIDEISDVRENMEYYSNKLTTARADLDELTLELQLAESHVLELKVLKDISSKKLIKAKKDAEKLTTKEGVACCDHEDMLALMESTYKEAVKAVDDVDKQISKAHERRETIIESLKPDNIEVEERLSKFIQIDNSDIKSSMSSPQVLIDSCNSCIMLLKDDIAKCTEKLNNLNEEKHRLRELVVESKNIEDEKRSKIHELKCEKQRLQLLISEASTNEKSLSLQIKVHSNTILKASQKMSQLEDVNNKYVSLIPQLNDENNDPNVDKGSSKSINDESINEILYSLKAEENSKREELKLLRQNLNKKGRRLQAINHATLKTKLRAVNTLQQQMKSVDDAIKLLEDGIQEAVGLMKDANFACFQKVSKSFSQQVSMLIPGRVGIMEQSGTTLEDGISISFATSGDNESHRGMSELSGGQKALVGLALTFSLSSFRQLPIYILDEIDAPLDEHNQAEAANAVTELFDGSQIICISHHTPFHKRADHIVQIARENESSKLLGVFHQSK